MFHKPAEANPPQHTTQDWQKQEGELATQALTQVLNEQTGRQRSAYAREWERHESLAEILMSSSPEARRLVETLGTTKIASTLLTQPAHVGGLASVRDHQLDIMHGLNGGIGDRLSVRGAPFDHAWTVFQPEGARGTAAHGPSASIQGHMSLDLTETYVDRPVAYGGWMRNAAGVGTWFKPKSPSTYVRVAPFALYNYRWKDQSWLQVAHNSGDFGVFIQRFISPGQFETILDNRQPLWRDGTGWYEDHEDEQSGYFADSNYFWASSNDWYLVWIWCNSGIDFATKTTFGSSKAFNNLSAGLRWLVFEQWA